MLREDKAQLTERVKGYESRIRKLEDLLHRGRTNSGNVYQVAGSSTPQPPSTPQPGQTFPNPGPSPLHTSDRPSSPATIRRISIENTDKPLMARITALEAELASEKELTARLQRDASARIDLEKAMNARISQADDTKRDLFANLEALNQQHVTERKELEREIEELRQKLEEAYEETDRVEDMKVEEIEKRAMIEDRVRGLEGELSIMGDELHRLRGMSEEQAKRVKELEEELEIARGSTNQDLENLKRELEEQRKHSDLESQKASEAEAALAASEQANRRLVETVRSLETQIKDLRKTLDETKLQSTTAMEIRESLANAIRQAHSQLSDDSPPDDLNTLMDSIHVLVAESVARNKELDTKFKEEQSKVKMLESSNALLQSRFDSRTIKAKDLTQRLYTHNARSIHLLESIGYRVIRAEDSMQIVKVSKTNTNDSTVLSRSTVIDAPGASKSSPLALTQSSTVEDINLLYWMETEDSDAETEKYSQYLKTIGAFDLDAFSDTVINRVKKVEQDCRQLMKQCRAYREKYYRSRDEANEKIAYKSFKQGDLALFLPTRNSVTRPWAAFNVGAPHFFLKEENSHKLATRDWLLARISKIEDRVVDLSRSTTSLNLPPSAVDRASIGGNSSDGASIDDENPFELSDGLRWYLLEAVEEKPGAPSTPGLSTSTVAAANVDAKGSLKSRKPVTGAKKTLTQITSDHSRRSSSGSNSHRNSLSVTPEAAERLREAVNGSASSPAVESTPSTPNGEKAVESLRGLTTDGAQKNLG
jgi:autophagy-related protein 11